MQTIFGWVLAPVAWLIGVPWQNAPLVGSFIGEKVVINEFVAYTDMSQHLSQLLPESRLIATYALCGFANFSSIAIQIGGIGGIAPIAAAIWRVSACARCWGLAGHVSHRDHRWRDQLNLTQGAA